jgi:LAO/AO transport system kinase
MPDRHVSRLSSTSQYVDGVRAGDRSALAQAITLIESRRPGDRAMADEVLAALLPEAGDSHRVGITGVPGVGKSTLIDQLGTDLTAGGRRVAVLAIDPSSTRTGGSILGDKTRMQRLANDPAAFVRPSPTAGTLGGVGRTTRETMLLCEAAGYDVVLVETVGVGQSEVVVAEMVDTFVLLMLAGGGDQLQGIKKGVLELADVIAFNKADGEEAGRARAAVAELQTALHLLAPRDDGWATPVVTCSAITDAGLDTVWDQIEAHRRHTQASGRWAERRRRQSVRWMWSLLEDRLMERFRADPRVQALLPDLEAAVAAGEITASAAVDRLLDR